MPNESAEEKSEEEQLAILMKKLDAIEAYLVKRDLENASLKSKEEIIKE